MLIAEMKYIIHTHEYKIIENWMRNERNNNNDEIKNVDSKKESEMFKLNWI